MASDYLDKLAEFVTSTRLEDLNNSTIMAAKTVVLDTHTQLNCLDLPTQNTAVASRIIDDSNWNTS
jgi:hypothetical protein